MEPSLAVEEPAMSCPFAALLRLAAAAAGVWLAQPIPADTPIQFGGAPAELTISQISQKCFRLALSPLDAQDRPLLGPASSVLAELPLKEKLRVRSVSGPKVVAIGRLQVVVKAHPLTVSLRDTDRKLLQELVFDEGTNAAVSFRTPAPLLGLGEGQHQFDRRGVFYPMINGQLAPLLATHGATIPVPLLLGTDGWALFVHRPWGQFDLRDGYGRFVPRKEALGREPLELFIIAGGHPADLVGEFIRLTGAPVMPPKWVLGYIQSHRTLDGPQQPVQVAQAFRDKKLPCDALIYLGTGYCTNGWNTGHGSLQFNPNAFDHPAEQLAALHQLNFKVVLHVNHAPRDLFGAAITERSDSPSHIGNYWARHRQLFQMGIDAWWPDDGDELPIEARLARHRCYFEGPLHDRPNIRPWSLHRNGYAGVMRYGGWIWSGDTKSRWATLAAHVPVGLNCSLSLTPFWGTDIGGFVPTPELTGELYVRWFQFGAFNPLFRSHGRTWHLRLPWGWNTGEAGPIESRSGPDPSEFHNAQVEPICRQYLELRYRLLPYNYTLIRQACDSGLPPMRALWLHYPDDPEATKIGDEYLWGRDILVAPVLEKGAHARRLYLPAGAWYDWWTGEKVNGGTWLTRSVDLATMPLYVRAGAIVPLDPVRQYIAEPVTQPTALQIYPGADGTSVLYEDDGQTLDYLHGQACWTRFRWDDRRRTLTIEPDQASKWTPGPRPFDVVLMATDQRKSVQYDGRVARVNF